MEMTRRRMIVGLGATSVAAVGAGVLLTRDGPPTPSRGAGQRTSFGTVALLGWSRRSLAAPHDHGAGHAHGAPATDVVPSAVHGAWTDAVSVHLQVHNGTQRPIELSPGQFRVRVAGGDVTVSLYGADRPAGLIGAGSTADLRIDYLAPPAGVGLSLEFADAISTRTHQLGRLGDGAPS